MRAALPKARRAFFCTFSGESFPLPFGQKHFRSIVDNEIEACKKLSHQEGSRKRAK